MKPCRGQLIRNKSKYGDNRCRKPVEASTTDKCAGKVCEPHTDGRER